MTYTPEFDASCEDVSAGRPNGSTDVVDSTKEMGYTPPTLDTVICLGVNETTNLVTGDVKKIEEKDYQQIYDIDILRGAMAYPDPKTFGKAPAEILMGLKITKGQQSKKEKLTQLV
ncbi:hypothetical protein BGZ65_002249 [Modicella reniformis]|uniref:Uncharacterized protein n=1 Tax=Modicella reniformis TaxID=1440133 RepID=A0A9P6J6X2_9FUNG|nr:hypothetical protein BGZ65_002249 [Modicella reniformis]